MKTLYTVAYPVLSDRNHAFIEQFRERHDQRHRSTIPAHFMLVFGCNTVPEPDYKSHVSNIIAGSRVISFCCRCATLGADDQDDTAYVFIVPDEGFSALSLLHDHLYTGLLAHHLQLDLPYIPHITLGTLQSRTEAKLLCDHLNRPGMMIQGSIHAVAVGAIENGNFINHASFEMQSQSN